MFKMTQFAYFDTKRVQHIKFVHKIVYFEVLSMSEDWFAYMGYHVPQLLRFGFAK